MTDTFQNRNGLLCLLLVTSSPCESFILNCLIVSFVIIEGEKLFLMSMILAQAAILFELVWQCPMRFQLSMCHKATLRLGYNFCSYTVLNLLSDMTSVINEELDPSLVSEFPFGHMICGHCVLINYTYRLAQMNLAICLLIF